MPLTEVRADPIHVTRLADQMLRSSQQIADAWHGAHAAPTAAPDSAGSVDVPVAAFGDSAAGGLAHDAHENMVDDAGVAVGRLVAVLEGDQDRLYRVALAYQKADDDAAGRLPVTPV